MSADARQIARASRIIQGYVTVTAANAVGAPDR